jgi:hypothetical protein
MLIISIPHLTTPPLCLLCGWTPGGRSLLAVIAVASTVWAVYQQVNVPVNRTGQVPVNSTAEMTLSPCAPPEPVPCTSLSPSSPGELPKISCVNRTEDKIVEVPGPERIVYRDVPGPERIVYRDVPGPERIVYRDKVVQVNHTVEKMVEVLKIIFVEKNQTEGTVCTCKAGYYSSTAGARF